MDEDKSSLTIPHLIISINLDQYIENIEIYNYEEFISTIATFKVFQPKKKFNLGCSDMYNFIIQMFNFDNRDRNNIYLNQKCYLKDIILNGLYDKLEKLLDRIYIETEIYQKAHEIKSFYEKLEDPLDIDDYFESEGLSDKNELENEINKVNASIEKYLILIDPTPSSNRTYLDNVERLSNLKAIYMIIKEKEGESSGKEGKSSGKEGKSSGKEGENSGKDDKATVISNIDELKKNLINTFFQINLEIPKLTTLESPSLTNKQINFQNKAINDQNKKKIQI